MSRHISPPPKPVRPPSTPRPATAGNDPARAAGPITRPTRLGSEVYDYVLQQLMSLTIKPDERIGVDRLARDLDVSQTPIREALSQLESQGLVVKSHLRGYRAVPQLTKEQFNDLTELRLLLEPVAAAKAAANMTTALRSSLAGVTRDMGVSAAAETLTAYSDFARQDAAFHTLISAACGNELIHSVLTERRTHLHLFRLRFYEQVTHEALREHAIIIRALDAQDPSAAAAAMRNHIKRAHQRFAKSYD